MLDQQLKQRTCEWCSEMADRGEKAVKAFFDRYEQFKSADARQAYVTWAVPAPEEKIDANGRKYFVPLPVYPYMWDKIEGKADNQVCDYSILSHH